MSNIVSVPGSMNIKLPEWSLMPSGLSASAALTIYTGEYFRDVAPATLPALQGGAGIYVSTAPVFLQSNSCMFSSFTINTASAPSYVNAASAPSYINTVSSSYINAVTPSYMSVNSAGFTFVVTTTNTSSSTVRQTLIPTWSVESYKDDYDFAKSPNWDDEGSVAIADDVLTNAETLFDELPRLPPPSEVSPLADGALSFVWDTSSGYLFLSVGPGRVLHVYYDIPYFGKWERVTSFDKPDTRARLKLAIGQLTGNTVSAITALPSEDQLRSGSETHLALAA